MKALIVTTQHVDNYGAVLQAYGFHRFLADKGWPHDFLEQKSMASKKRSRKKNLKQVLADIYYGLIRLGFRTQLKEQEERFDNFRSRYIPEIPIEQAGNYDLYVTGGDQMFNRSCLSRPINFLKFGRADTLRISFCTSSGSAVFSNEELDTVASNLSAYDALSFREKGMILMLSGRIDVPMRTDVDCSFLISPDEWREAESFESTENLPENYILVYELMHHIDTVEVINELKEACQLPVVTIASSPRKDFKSDYYILNAGPGEFVALFDKASVVSRPLFMGHASQSYLRSRLSHWFKKGKKE